MRLPSGKRGENGERSSLRSQEKEENEVPLPGQGKEVVSPPGQGDAAGLHCPISQMAKLGWPLVVPILGAAVAS